MYLTIVSTTTKKINNCHFVILIECLSNSIINLFEKKDKNKIVLIAA